MNHRLNIDQAGRVVLPKPVRDRLQLEPGESLEMESYEDHIVLRPIRGNVPLRKKRGIWVFRADTPLAASEVDDTIRKVREERDDEVSGRK